MGVAVIHHDFYQHRHQIAKDGGGIAQLVAVGAGVVSSATVDDLVSEGVQAVKNNA